MGSPKYNFDSQNLSLNLKRHTLFGFICHKQRYFRQKRKGKEQKVSFKFIFDSEPILILCRNKGNIIVKSDLKFGYKVKKPQVIFKFGYNVNLPTVIIHPPIFLNKR